jgi:hypothetical protein
MSTVRCRAAVSSKCKHGRPLIEHFGDPDATHMSDDGTYITESDSIVCDPCYIKLGTPLNPVLPNAQPAS